MRTKLNLKRENSIRHFGKSTAAQSWLVDRNVISRESHGGLPLVRCVPTRTRVSKLFPAASTSPRASRDAQPCYTLVCAPQKRAEDATLRRRCSARVCLRPPTSDLQLHRQITHTFDADARRTPSLTSLLNISRAAICGRIRCERSRALGIPRSRLASSAAPSSRATHIIQHSILGNNPSRQVDEEKNSFCRGFEKRGWQRERERERTLIVAAACQLLAIIGREGAGGRADSRRSVICANKLNIKWRV